MRRWINHDVVDLECKDGEYEALASEDITKL